MFEKCRTCPDFEIYEGDDGKTAYCLQGHEIGEGCDVNAERTEDESVFS